MTEDTPITRTVADDAEQFLQEQRRSEVDRLATDAFVHLGVFLEDYGRQGLNTSPLTKDSILEEFRKFRAGQKERESEGGRSVPDYGLLDVLSAGYNELEITRAEADTDEGQMIINTKRRVVIYDEIINLLEKIAKPVKK